MNIAQTYPGKWQRNHLVCIQHGSKRSGSGFAVQTNLKTACPVRERAGHLAEHNSALTDGEHLLTNTEE